MSTITVEFIGELIGTFILILLGNGVVANVVLNDTKGNDSGWIVITFGWGMAVFAGVIAASQFSPAHLNPAVTIGLAAAGTFAWAKVPAFIIAQMLGAMIGAGLVWLVYRQHYERTDDGDSKLATFCTGPAIRSNGDNFISELTGTFVLVFAALYIAAPELSATELTDANFGLGSVGALPIALIVFSIGMSLGGTTGYAINPARDLGPRIMHAILPISAKRDNDWGYSWIPVAGPIAGGVVAALLYHLLQPLIA